ncbi:MAG TPA: sulfite exporter TauE/SafE family protein [Spirochaetota bacterium]|mgnify:CR=1 FL=1|nr:sulfite exporter TauE/SafE family protein [Spirochaetota bacterium]HPS86077.1 sulfite exporter TauE/SafE family protein [Spirochaetota bacterium]
MNIFVIVLIGLGGGIASGLLGIGGAIVMVPALIFLAGYDQITAQGTTLIAMIPPIGIFAALEYYKAGHADIKTAAVIAAVFIIGAWAGSKLALNINPQILKKIFGVLLLYISFKMILS